jgi:Major Facilitator Superfamily
VLLVSAVREEAHPPRSPGGYRRVLRDGALVRFALVNVVMIAVGWGILAWLVPPYARGIGIGSGAIGLLVLANAATVVLAQVPIVKAAEGRSRVGALSLAAVCWIVACLLALLAQAGGPAVAYGCLLVAAVLFAVGECLHATSFLPLIADLAPIALRGRYLATASLSWWVGLGIAPTLGASLLAISPSLPLVGGAALAATAIVLLHAFERALPLGARTVPQPSKGV